VRNADGARYEGFGEWADLSEALIRGLSHGLTNRISSIGSFVQLHGMGDTEFTVEGFLPKESGQLQELARGLRLLVIDAEPSAVELLPLLRDAIELYSHHGRMHALRCEISITGEPLHPIRVVRSAVLRLILIMLDMCTAEVHESGGAEVLLAVAGSMDELLVSVAVQRTPSEYAMALAEASGSSLLAGDGRLELRIPTLVALRAR
jgi:hypothetical protein